MLAQHPVKERFDAFWIVPAGWSTGGALPAPRAGGAHGGRAVAPAGPRADPADEIDEVRIVASWIAEHEPPTLTLDPAPEHDLVAAFAAEAAPAGAPAEEVVSAA